MAWDWNIIIGSAISFVFAVILLFLREFIIWIKERNKKKGLFIDLFNGFSKLYDNEGSVLLFRTLPLILDEIQKKLKMDTSLDYEFQDISEFDSKIKTVYQIKDPTKMIIWIYNSIWYIELRTTILANNIEPDFSIVLTDLRKKRTFFENEIENLIKFLDYLEKEYRKVNIIRSKKTLLSDDIKEKIKSYYSKRDSKK